MKNLITKSLLIVTILAFTLTWTYSADIEYTSREVITAGDITVQCKDHIGIWNQSIREAVAFHNANKMIWAVNEYINMPILFETNIDGSVKKDVDGLPVFKLGIDNKPLIRVRAIEGASSLYCNDIAESLEMSPYFFRLVNPLLPCKE